MYKERQVDKEQKEGWFRVLKAEVVKIVKNMLWKERGKENDCQLDCFRLKKVIRACKKDAKHQSKWNTRILVVDRKH